MAEGSLPHDLFLACAGSRHQGKSQKIEVELHSTLDTGHEMSARKLWPLALVAVLVAAAFQLRNQGRSWWCSCDQFFLWAGDIWSSHNSQHLLDPYSFTHVLHGFFL